MENFIKQENVDVKTIVVMSSDEDNSLINDEAVSFDKIIEIGKSLISIWFCILMHLLWLSYGKFISGGLDEGRV